MERLLLTPSGVFHDVDPELYDIAGVDLVRLTLLGALAQALVVDEGAVAALGVLQQELHRTQTQTQSVLEAIHTGQLCI